MSTWNHVDHVLVDPLVTKAQFYDLTKLQVMGQVFTSQLYASAMQ